MQGSGPRRNRSNRKGDSTNNLYGPERSIESVVLNSKLRCLRLREGPADKFAQHLNQEKCPGCIAFLRALDRGFRTNEFLYRNRN